VALLLTVHVSRIEAGWWLQEVCLHQTDQCPARACLDVHTGVWNPHAAWAGSFNSVHDGLRKLGDCREALCCERLERLQGQRGECRGSARTQCVGRVCSLQCSRVDSR
jgi:hypothetical protein